MAMVSPRSVGLMLAATAVAGWFETSVVPSPVVRPAVAQQTARAQGGQRGRSTEFAIQAIPDTTKVREILSDAPHPARRRNPFVYGSRAASRVASIETAPADIPAAAPLEPALPIFKLSGIASNAEGDAVTLTAIIVDNGAMVFARAGDKLSNGYSVVKVDEMSVTLVDATGVTQTIRLP